jgi:hypothetical protein
MVRKEAQILGVDGLGIFPLTMYGKRAIVGGHPFGTTCLIGPEMPRALGFFFAFSKGFNHETDSRIHRRF